MGAEKREIGGYGSFGYFYCYYFKYYWGFLRLTKNYQNLCL